MADRMTFGSLYQSPNKRLAALLADMDKGMTQAAKGTRIGVVSSALSGLAKGLMMRQDKEQRDDFARAFAANDGKGTIDTIRQLAESGNPYAGDWLTQQYQEEFQRRAAEKAQERLWQREDKLAFNKREQDAAQRLADMEQKRLDRESRERVAQMGVAKDQAAREYVPSEAQIRAKQRVFQAQQEAESRAKMEAPMPSVIVKQQSDLQENIGTAAQNVKMSEYWADALEGGKLNLGGYANIESAIRNFTGWNDRNSQLFSQLKVDLNGMRNRSLRLAKGVQTDGDAQREWDGLFAKLSDPQALAASLRRIAEMDNRNIELTLGRLNTMRGEYGRNPMAMDQLLPSDQYAGPVGGAAERSNGTYGSVQRPVARQQVLPGGVGAENGMFIPPPPKGAMIIRPR